MKHLIRFNSSIKVVNQQVYKDFKNLCNWLNANKICLNVCKTEVVLFKSEKNKTKKTKKKQSNNNNLTLTQNLSLIGKGHT